MKYDTISLVGVQDNKKTRKGLHRRGRKKVMINIVALAKERIWFRFLDVYEQYSRA